MQKQIDVLPCGLINLVPCNDQVKFLPVKGVKLTKYPRNQGKIKQNKKIRTASFQCNFFKIYIFIDLCLFCFVCVLY